jgi:hypothetical protein
MFDWDPTNPPHLPLADATDLSVAEFYQTFKGTSKPPCLKTPEDLWP